MCPEKIVSQVNTMYSHSKQGFFGKDILYQRWESMGPVSRCEAWHWALAYLVLFVMPTFCCSGYITPSCPPRTITSSSGTARPKRITTIAHMALSADVRERNRAWFDIVVIGGGSAGITAAKLATNVLGKSAVLIEKAKVGGDCTWTGCVPSKTLIAASKALTQAQKFGLAALPGSGTSSSASARQQQFAKIRQTIRNNQDFIYEKDDSPETLEKLGVTVLKGEATLVSDKTVRVELRGGRETLMLNAKEGIVICTGARPAWPAGIPGLVQPNENDPASSSNIAVYTYETIWDQMEILPRRMTIMGGGPIGCEMAQAYARLGSNVTIVAPSLLPQEDAAAGIVLQQVFAEQGITIVKGRIAEVEPDGNRGHVAVCDTAANTKQPVVGDVLVVATGRIPNDQGMGLSTAGVKRKENDIGIQVNKKLQTTLRGVYAAGDCTGDAQFTHYAGYQGAIAVRNILLPLSDLGVMANVPHVTFTDPEVASIGLTEMQAIREHGADKVAVSQHNLRDVDRAICEGTAQHGFFKIVYHKKTGKIWGATLVSPNAGELIAEIALAMHTGTGFWDLTNVMVPYPTYSMGLQLMAADVYYDRVMRRKGLYEALRRIGL